MSFARNHPAWATLALFVPVIALLFGVGWIVKERLLDVPGVEHTQKVAVYETVDGTAIPVSDLTCQKVASDIEAFDDFRVHGVGGEFHLKSFGKASTVTDLTDEVAAIDRMNRTTLVLECRTQARWYGHDKRRVDYAVELHGWTASANTVVANVWRGEQ